MCLRRSEFGRSSAGFAAGNDTESDLAYSLWVSSQPHSIGSPRLFVGKIKRIVLVQIEIH